VEDEVFKMPRPIFAESQVFQSLLARPADETPVGSAAAPLVLLNVEAKDFRIFARAALCLCVITHPTVCGT
jgi:hypothetical protein